MVTIESKKINLSVHEGVIFTFLNEINHLGEILPHQVEDFSSSEGNCQFKIKNMTTLYFTKKETMLNKKIILESIQPMPFAITWEMTMNQITTTNTEIQFILLADMNPMIKLMAFNPLQNFLNLILDNIQKKFEAYSN